MPQHNLLAQQRNLNGPTRLLDCGSYPATKTKLNKKPSIPTIEVADDKKKPKELISNMIDTTLTNYTNLKTKLQSKLEVILEQNKIPIEDKPSNKEVCPTRLTNMDDRTQAFCMGEKLGVKFDSRMTTPIHSHSNSQPNTNEAPNIYATNETWHIIQASLNDNRTFPPDNHNNHMKPMTTAMMPQ